MFGYVKPVIKELLVKEYEFYKATYCGICRAMKKETGYFSNVTLTYDSVFLALVRMAYIDDAELTTKMRHCGAHPLKKRCMLNSNSAIDYTVKAFGILSYYKLKDDYDDEKFAKKMAVTALRPVASHAKNKANLQDLEKMTFEKLKELKELEDSNCESVDRPANVFGELLGEIFSYGLKDSDKLVTHEIGLHLGKFIYVADAAEDYDEDLKLGRYNPFILSYNGKPLTKENKQTIKLSLILECKKLESAINLVPFEKKITAENIVRNIIYLGLVSRIKFLDEDDKDGCDKNSDCNCKNKK